MNIQAEKLELIKRLAEVNNKKIIEKLKAILMPELRAKPDETEKILADTALTKKIRAARAEIREGKGVKVKTNDLWK